MLASRCLLAAPRLAASQHCSTAVQQQEQQHWAEPACSRICACPPARRAPASLTPLPTVPLAHPPLPPARAVQISQTAAMLANEYGTASNIKSRVNRQSVLAAITSAQQRLKLYTRVGGGWRGVCGSAVSSACACKHMRDEEARAGASARACAQGRSHPAPHPQEIRPTSPAPPPRPRPSTAGASQRAGCVHWHGADRGWEGEEAERRL